MPASLDGRYAPVWLMLCVATVFVGTHLGISSSTLRENLVERLGERGYLAVYSLIAVLTLGLTIWVYNTVPRYEYLWALDPRLYLVPKLLMPVALILALGGFMVRNPTIVGMEGALADATQIEATLRGVNRITRHPFQWGVVLWAISHMAANGDAVSVMFFGSFALLSLLGTVLMDRKKARRIGANWTLFAERTSNVPFVAVLTGRNRLVARELIAPIVVGLVVYGVLYWGHQWVSGVRIL